VERVSESFLVEGAVEQRIGTPELAKTPHEELNELPIPYSHRKVRVIAD